MTIELRSLVVRYRKALALADVSLSIPQGAVFALLGRNGAGKSSLLKVLLGLRRQDGGACSVLGLDPWRQRASLMARIGATPEAPDAPPSMTIAAIERTVSALHKSWSGEDFGARLERFDIDRRRRFGQLSRGQKSLVMLALALAHRPELLLLDDPTLGLDPVARRHFFEELVVDLADRGTTVFLATHDLDGVQRVATHVGMLDKGRVVADGPIDDVRAGLDLEERFVALLGGEWSAA